MTFISNSGATLAFTAGSTAVTVAGTNPLLEGVIVGDLAVHPNGALPIAARSASGLTLVLPAPTTATVPFNVMLGPARSLVAQATQLTRDVYAQLAAWADRGLSIPVIAQQNAPPSSPADTDTYLVGTSGSGAWSGRSNQLAIWSSALSQWQYRQAFAGWQVTINGTATRLQWTGTAWATAAVLAGDVALTPVGAVAATNVQAAIEELDTEKAARVTSTTVGRLARFTGSTGAMGQSSMSEDGSGNVTLAGGLTAPAAVSVLRGVVGTQQIIHAMGWSGGVVRVARVLEGDGSISDYSYDAAGVSPVAMATLARSGALTLASAAGFDASGRFFSASQPGFFALSGGNSVTLSNGTNGPLAYNTTVHNKGSAFNGTTFTFPRAGVGLFIFQGGIAGGTADVGAWAAQIRRNGTVVGQSYQSKDSRFFQDHATFALINGNAGDTVDTTILLDSMAGTVNATGRVNFCGALLS